MSLTNSQIDEINRLYDERRMLNQQEADRRREYVEKNVDGYKELSDAIASLSVEHAKKMIMKQTNSMDELRSEINNLISAKKALLVNASLPEDYLDPIYDCEDCKDTGYINGQKCHCFRQMSASLLYSKSNLNDQLKEVSFSMVSDKYYEGDELVAFQDTYNKAISFVKNFDTEFKNLLIYGTVGSGKSLMSSCIAKELIENGHSVLYFSASTLMDLFSKYSFDYGIKQDIYEAYSDLFECDLLIIDDLGTEMINNFSITALFSCLNKRLLNKKSTIISTNLSPKAIDETYTERIYSRLVGNYTFCKLYGPDIRFKNKFNK